MQCCRLLYGVVLFVYSFVWQQAMANSGYPSVPCLKLRRNGRVVGGVDSERGETPFIVSLTRRGGHFCGGIVLNNHWLLTAGHCICNGVGRIMKPSQIKAMLGLYKISDTKNNAIDSNAYEMDIINIVPHPKYSCTSPDNDIALLEVAKPILFDSLVRPACISINSQDDANGHKPIPDGQMATVSGWGWTNEDQEIGERADILQKAVVNVWNSDKCQRLYSEYAKGLVLTERQICAGFEAGGIDSCWADSGGPLVTNGNVLIGVVSTGVGCARPGLPGIYTKVSEYVDWIQMVAGM